MTSHGDAPSTMLDPAANNTDVYAFKSSSNKVTLIANYIPFEEPAGGPLFYQFDDRVLYEIMIDNNGDAKEDVTYQFRFKTEIANPTTLLYNTGLIGPGPTYANLNLRQTFSIAKVLGDRRTGSAAPLGSGLITPPNRVGPASTGDQTYYESLVAPAIHMLPSGEKVFAGQREEGFYLDLGAIFDLANLRSPGKDTLGGYNVHSIAIEVPISDLTNSSKPTFPVIGVWASASRQKARVLAGRGSGSENPETHAGPFTQVSRLGNPLVCETLVPLSHKDLYNATQPKDDATNIANFIINPGPTQSPGPSLAAVLQSVTGCTPASALLTNRFDLKLALLQGIPAGALAPLGEPFASFNNSTGPVVADMLRLNTSIPQAATPSPLGLLGADVAGWPNGRRPGDDVLDIALKAVGGAVLQLLGLIACPGPVTPLNLGDNVNGNDGSYLPTFPYLGTPHDGRSHTHDHV